MSIAATHGPEGAAIPTVERPIGYIASDMGGRSVEEIVELLADSGYRAVDWTMEQYDPLRETPQRLAEIVARSHTAGLATPQLMVHQDHVTLDTALWEERVHRSERAVLACAHAGIDSIGVLSGPNPWEVGYARIGRDLSEARGWELAQLALERVLDRAEEESVRVALEPCWGTLAYDRYRAEYLLARLDCAALAINLDPSHLVLSGDDIPGAVQAWGGRIAHVHLKDAFGATGMEGEDFTFLLPGEGAVPWAALFDALDAIGYTGAMCVENEAHRLLEGPLRGDLARSAALARELVRGLLGAPGGPAGAEAVAV
jgi:sugar phosphate isomerase/epimerase